MLIQRTTVRSRGWISSTLALAVLTTGMILSNHIRVAAGAQRPGNDTVSERERQALATLTGEIEGAVVYGRRGHIHKVILGETTPIDLGEGSYARWSADGKQIAVWHNNTVSVMQADGTGRKRLVQNAVKEEDGCPIEFHPNGREIIYGRRGDGLWAVNIADGATHKLPLPADYTGEPCFSADGKRLATRIENDLFAVDLVTNTHRKYAVGCSPNVSPDGARLLNNTGGHRQLVLRDWAGGNETRIDTRTMRPDREWDDHHWSNHNDYLTTNGEGSREEAYIIRISANRVTRVSWEGHAEFPDLFCVSSYADGAPTRRAVLPARGQRNVGSCNFSGSPTGVGAMPLVVQGETEKWNAGAVAAMRDPRGGQR